MPTIDLKRCALGALLITLVLWVSGLVTVPFANQAARQWLALWISADAPGFSSWAHQVENLLYAVGRLPLLFAGLVALRIWEQEERGAS